jgi:hypothetical protein
MKCININEVKPYISKSETDKDNPTVFHIGVLDSIIRAHIEDKTSGFEAIPGKPEEEAQVKLDLAMRSILTVKFGVKRIDNLIDPETNQPMQFEPEIIMVAGKAYMGLPDKILSVISNIQELANVILTRNGLSEAERKN